MSTTPAQQSDNGNTAESHSADETQGTNQSTVQVHEELNKDAAPLPQQEDDGKKALCGVCNVNTPKYKCPRCYLP